MNTGAEAVETAIKVARKWGYQVKGVPAGQAKIVVADGQLPRPHHHHRQLLHRPGRPRRLRAVHARASGSCPYGDLDALAAAIDDEHRRRAAGADPGRGRACWCRRPATCRAYASSAPSATCCSSPTRSSPGWAAPARTFACDHEGVVPDMYMLGKALGGGIVPVSAVAANADVLGVLQPGRARLDLRRQPAGLRGRPSRWSGCCAPASSSARSAELGDRLHGRPGRAGRQGRGRRCAAAGCGPASTSTRR